MNREDLKTGMEVMVIPIQYNKDLPSPEGVKMFVRELNNPLTAGLSIKKTGKKHILGILYSVIHPCAVKSEQNCI